MSMRVRVPRVADMLALGAAVGRCAAAVQPPLLVALEG